MDANDHLRTVGVALKNWLVAQSYDALAVGLMWLAGLLLIGVPWAPLWAVLGGLLQFVPNIGAVLGLIGPAAAGLFSNKPERALWVLGLYAVIVMVDGFVLQPFLMKRTAKVPIWASLITPIVLGILIPFWGVLIAAPLLAVVYAFKQKLSAPAETQRRG